MFKGTNYHGWQIQPNAKTVQGELNKAIQLLTKENTETIGAGRTDTGVHAQQFYVHFVLKNKLTDLPVFCYKLNQILDFDIAIEWCKEVNDDFHARFSAISRTYKYFIHQQKNPFLNDSSYFIFHPLNIDLMNKACEIIKTHTDFTSFSKLHTDVKNNNCQVTEAYFENDNNQIVFTITADRFLRNMVRAIVGTLLEIGKEKMSLNDLTNVFKAKDRAKAGMSVPAHALYLWEILYPDNLLPGK